MYPLKRAGHALPALSPEHVTLGRIPLGQPPSLHRLRSLRLGLVRRLRWYYRAVRLPVPGHHRCASLDFPTRPVIPSPTDRHGISRFPHKVLACMRRVLDRAEPRSISRYRRPQCGLPLASTASALRSARRLHDGVSISRLNTWPARTPVNASSMPLRTKMHDSETVWVATPSLYEYFIHSTSPVFPGAPKHENHFFRALLSVYPTLQKQRRPLHFNHHGAVLLAADVSESHQAAIRIGATLPLL